MKGTPYTVKAQRAMKAWKSLKEKTSTKTNHQTKAQMKSPMEFEFLEMAHES